VVGGDAHLRLGVDAVEAGPVRRVPDADSAISRAAPRRKQVLLEWAPRNGFDGPLVAHQRVDGLLQAGQVPDEQLVVVTAAYELGAVGRPAKRANLRVGQEQPVGYTPNSERIERRCGWLGTSIVPCCVRVCYVVPAVAKSSENMPRAGM